MASSFSRLIISLFVLGSLVPIHAAEDPKQADRSCDAPDPASVTGFAKSLLDQAKMSPKYVGDRNKEAWLKLFAKDGFIEDPVGAPRHYDVSRFYDTFIGPHTIVFDEKQDWVDVDRYRVYRDVDIHITFIDNYTVQIQPAHLLYTFTPDLKLQSLRAYWSMYHGYPLIKSNLLVDGAYYGVGATRVFYRVFSNMGLGFGYEYTKGLMKGTFSGGKAYVERFIIAINERNQEVLTKLFTSPESIIELPKKNATALTLFTELDNFQVKEITQGKLFESGYSTSARLEITDASGVAEAISIFELSPEAGGIMRVQIMW